MNTPIDPREGNRRQKALQARLAALAQKNKAMVGRTGASRGRVQAIGARAGGTRIAGNGQSRPGALNFLPQAGFGLMRGAANPGLVTAGLLPRPRHTANPLPSRALPILAGAPETALPAAPTGPAPQQAPVSQPEPPATIQGPQPSLTNQDLPPSLQLEGVAPEAPVISSYQPQPMISAGPLPQSQPAVSDMDLLRTGGLIPLGGGRYFNPMTGAIHGIRDSGAGAGRSFAV